MSEEESQSSADERPVFPYHVLWPGYGNANVDLRELIDQADEYRVFAEVARTRYKVRFTTEQEVASVLARHEVDTCHTLSFWVITCFYLAPRMIAAFGIDPGQSRAALARAADHAEELARLLGHLSPKVHAALFYIRPSVDDMINPEGPAFFELSSEAHDFAKAARAAAEDLTAAEGRPREHVRDTMLRLLMELIEEAGPGDLRVSNGTEARPDPHLAGKAGALMTDLIQLVEPTWAGDYLAPRVKAVRTKMRRNRKADASGGKTRPE